MMIEIFLKEKRIHKFVNSASNFLQENDELRNYIEFQTIIFTKIIT